MAYAKTSKQQNNGADFRNEADLWQMANVSRDSMDTTESEYVVLGLMFLKYNSDEFEQQRATPETERISS